MTTTDNTIDEMGEIDPKDLAKINLPKPIKGKLEFQSTPPNPKDPQALRRQVERLIIENRNSLNDPTTNEPYDVKGIADDVIELFQTAQQQLITELLSHAVDEGEVFKYSPNGSHFERKVYVPVSLLEQKLKDLGGQENG